MFRDKPAPPVARKPPKTCPVCGEVSYSAGGIHPQCSARQLDEEMRETIKEEIASAEKTEKVDNATRWQKTCPKCKSKQHVRKKVCECGHAFPV